VIGRPEGRAYNRRVEREPGRRIMSLPLRAKARLLWRMARDPQVPLRAKAVLPAIAAYVVMPVDIIPDFIPVLGQLDDIVVVGLGLALFVRLTPQDVVESHLGALE
jgi:uncharacterized membrane protein YkvA (DUF1232 family)